VDALSGMLSEDDAGEIKASSRMKMGLRMQDQLPRKRSTSMGRLANV